MWRNPQSKTATIAELVPIWEMNAGTAEKDLISNSVDPYSIEINQWSEAGSKQAGRQARHWQSGTKSKGTLSIVCSIVYSHGLWQRETGRQAIECRRPI